MDAGAAAFATFSSLYVLGLYCLLALHNMLIALPTAADGVTCCAQAAAEWYPP
jgi:hypothetical protein